VQQDITNTPGAELKASAVWLKATIDDQASGTFACRLDGKQDEPIGGSIEPGWVAVDSFEFDCLGPHHRKPERRLPRR
jgi:hypothetical protein